MDVVLAVIAYFLIGIVIGVAIVGDESSRVIFIMFWPIAIVMFLIFIVIGACYKLGMWIHENIVNV